MLIVTVAGIGLGLRTLKSQLHAITAVAEPMSAAAYEMEISIIRTGMGVVNYLLTAEPYYRQQVEQDAATFARFNSYYDSLPKDSHHRPLGTDFSAIFRDYLEITDTLMTTAARQRVVYSALAESFEVLHGIINDRIRKNLDVAGPQGPLKLLGTANLAAYTANIGTWLGSYTRTSDPSYKQQLLQGEEAVEKELTWFKTLKLSQKEREWAAELEQRYSQARAEIVEAIGLHDGMRHDMGQSLALRSRLDSVLKSDVRPLARSDLVNAQEGARGVLQTILISSLVLLGVAIPIALGTSVTVGKAVLKSEARIAELLARERNRTTHLRQLVEVSLTINAANTPEAVLTIVEDEACKIIGARSCVVERGSDTPQPLPGELTATFREHDGKATVVIRLSEKLDGAFTDDDELLVKQLASMVSAALENASLYDELRQRDQRKDEFLATLGHELRNPLAPIGSALEILRLAKGDDATTDHALELIERQFLQLTRIVDDLLDVSRITRGRIGLRMERVSLQDIVQTAIDASRPLVEGFRQELTVDLPTGTVWLRADPTRLNQVIANLLNNAAKYTPEGGHIHLSVERERDELAIKVRDTGIGISADKLPQVFDLFAQVDPSQERALGGLGIGLFLVKRLVEMHGGTVTAISRGRGHGAEFVVRLPVPSGAALLEGPSESPGSTGIVVRHRVLVADDNRDAAQSLCTLLKLWGHEVRLAYDGPQTLEEALRFRPELVLLDIGLPKMHGYDVAQRLREHPELRDVILVAVTGWGQEEDRRHAYEAGFDHHVTKPADLNVLKALLAALKK